MRDDFLDVELACDALLKLSPLGAAFAAITVSGKLDNQTRKRVLDTLNGRLHNPWGSEDKRAAVLNAIDMFEPLTIGVYSPDTAPPEALPEVLTEAIDEMTAWLDDLDTLAVESWHRVPIDFWTGLDGSSARLFGVQKDGLYYLSVGPACRLREAPVEVCMKFLTHAQDFFVAYGEHLRETCATIAELNRLRQERTEACSAIVAGALADATAEFRTAPDDVEPEEGAE